jgi:hypothetical protein
METNYFLRVNELTEEFLKDFKETYMGKQIEIIVREIEELFPDESDHQKKEYEYLEKRFEKYIGKTERFGKVAEFMIASTLQEEFEEIGIEFSESARNVSIYDSDRKFSFGIDVLLKNTDKAMLVKVKMEELSVKDVIDHIERIEKMRRYADFRGDTRTFMGAVAGVVVSVEAKQYALKQGLFVIEPSGGTFNITLPEGEPKEW